MPHIRQVALIVETSSIYGRRLLEGVNRYVQTHRPWSIFLDQSDLFARPPAWLATWRGDGIICRTRRSLLAIDPRRQPIVDLSDIEEPRPGVPRIESDHAAIGRLAADHLLNRGFRRFAFCGFSDHRWSELRHDGFKNRIAATGHDVHSYRSTWSGRRDRSWVVEQRRIERWLRRLKKPVGIMAANDLRGQHVLDAAARANLAIPETVAVIGCDNDELLCSLGRPPLSSVVPHAARVGYEAAGVLDRLMDGRHVKASSLLIEPLDVVTRQSSDVLAIEDALVAESLRIIRERASFGLSVEELLEELAVSRTTLERRFREQLGRSPHAEIRRAQLKRVKELLAGTELPLDRIARLTGFAHPEYLSVLFKRTERITPGRYRRQSQMR
ncbi:MAG: helix-turn-helix domain-containing protein [Planctomycetes bacterium]|nr:helix-turn-helix domain-containing protein [Planctomycetota bacterium]